jgi:hypothetical protein
MQLRVPYNYRNRRGTFHLNSLKPLIFALEKQWAVSEAYSFRRSQLRLPSQHCCAHFKRTVAMLLQSIQKTWTVLWNFSCNCGKQYEYLKVCLILSDLHRVVSQNTGIYISKSVAKTNLRQTRCLQDGSYGDLLVSKKWSQLNFEPV